MPVTTHSVGGAGHTLLHTRTQSWQAVGSHCRALAHPGPGRAAPRPLLLARLALPRGLALSIRRHMRSLPLG